jgi:hypothetical protein
MSRRVCSFCKVSGHTITHCNSPLAIELIQSTEFKSGIVMQYFGTGEEKRMNYTILDWFRSLTITKLKLIIGVKGFITNGTKIQLIARAIWVYLYNVEPPIHIFDNERQMSRFRTLKQHFYQISIGMEIRAVLPRTEVDPTVQCELLTIIDGLPNQEIECPICFDTKQNIAKTNCGHFFCRECIQKHTKDNVASCPCCRTKVDMIVVNDTNPEMIVLE